MSTVHTFQIIGIKYEIYQILNLRILHLLRPIARDLCVEQLDEALRIVGRNEHRVDGAAVGAARVADALAAAARSAAQARVSAAVLEAQGIEAAVVRVSRALRLHA